MYKIKYPSGKGQLAAFHQEYLDCLKVNTTEIDRQLGMFGTSYGTMSFEKLAVMPFEDLIRFEPEIRKYYEANLQKHPTSKIKVEVVPFSNLFDYHSNQPQIADVLMNQESMAFDCCHYCGIDYISSFRDSAEFLSDLDFLNFATSKELQMVPGIGEVKANKIIDLRKKGRFMKMSDSGLTQDLQTKIANVDLKKTHNHFTLDHFFPQSDYPFYSLCLYNLVPSCNACNSKFKGASKFHVHDRSKRISPSSSSYALSEMFSFGMLFEKDRNQILSKKDFVIWAKVLDRTDQLDIEKYFEMFKIAGRYAFHKQKALELHKARLLHPDTKIAEIASQTGYGVSEIKCMLFGSELFDPEKVSNPLSKFKRDIARDLGIDGVV